MSASFREYLSKRHRTDTPQGDFVEDACGDRNLPDVKTWDELEGYLRSRNSVPEAIEAARTVWRQYQSQHG